MTLLVQYAVLCCVAAGLVTGAVALVIARDGRAALRIALDFWLAAGLLRLGAAAGGEPLLATAAIMAVRQLVAWSLRRPAR
ncbi:hypothetical protein [Actinomadura macrotermitis]|uniref:DUF1622 domain-containing protein n=1 Tax=Actinomadura macrotermitis TaxID=2585200 RepID=A0A7K0BSW6_9ACTN|nr:hypothetical protein [Actinomadura macrotermitis]MQY03982.1 hypothetical protein [Actinomadura macrotermitis]